MPVQSLREKAVKPRRIGIGKRKAWRVNIKKSKHTMARYRYGYRLIWSLSFAGAYASRLTNFNEPGTYDPKNQHGGAMPALPGDFSLSGKQAATLLEKCADTDGVTWDQLRAVSACLSYLHALSTGEDGTNWKEVQSMWDSLQYSLRTNLISLVQIAPRLSVFKLYVGLGRTVLAENKL